MAIPKHTPGVILRIPLADGTFGYGRLLEPPYVAFYDHRTSKPSDDLGLITAKRVLFTQAVRSSGLHNWTRLGIKPLERELLAPIVRYSQDLLDHQKCVIFDTLGNERQATPEECIGLEEAAVWEPHHIEERLLDTFLGRPNNEELRSRVRLE